MKAKWQLFLFVSLIFLLTSSVIGCGESYAQEDLDAARQATHEAGYAQGYSAGYAEGYDAGLIELESVKQGAEKLGYDKGFETGIASLEAAGFIEPELEALRARLEAMLPTETLPEDLAYISAYVSNYSDDATPEPNGISLRITFYDSKSKLIAVKSIPLTVTINLYDLGIFPSSFYGDRRALIYQDRATLDYSTWENIRIPFGDLKVTLRSSSAPKHEVEVEVTVTTPNQGNFSATSIGLAQLYK